MWLPGDLSVLATGNKFMIDLFCGVSRGSFGLDVNWFAVEWYTSGCGLVFTVKFPFVWWFHLK